MSDKIETVRVEHLEDGSVRLHVDEADSDCALSCRFSESELNGLGWLNRTMMNIIDKGEGHPSYVKACGALAALVRYKLWTQAAHHRLHELEDEVRLLTATLKMNSEIRLANGGTKN
jgi:hypothetical protein